MTVPRGLRDASTVVLVRDGDRGIETFLITRVNEMAFAPGMTVFPGGGVDPADGTMDLAFTGATPEWFGEQFSCDALTARKLVCAAFRELFEEVGVLLADNADGSAPDMVALQPFRDKLAAHELSVPEFVRATGLRLRFDLLRPVDHWITPEGLPIRYDTRFFVAAMPAGQQADGRTSEAASAGWFTATDALAAEEDGTFTMLAPTCAQLSEVASATTVSELLTRDRVIRTHQPTHVDRDGIIHFD